MSTSIFRIFFFVHIWNDRYESLKTKFILYSGGTVKHWTPHPGDLDCASVYCFMFNCQWIRFIYYYILLYLLSTKATCLHLESITELTKIWSLTQFIICQKVLLAENPKSIHPYSTSFSVFLLSRPRKQKLVLFFSIATMLKRNLGLFIFSLLGDVMNSKLAQLFWATANSSSRLNKVS